MNFTEDQLEQPDFQVRELDSYSSAELSILMEAVVARWLNPPLAAGLPDPEVKRVLDIWMRRIKDAWKEAKGREEELPFE
jgi:hypothetical protein